MLNLSKTLPKNLRNEMTLADMSFFKSHGRQKRQSANREQDPSVIFSTKVYRTQDGGCKDSEEFLLSYRIYALLYGYSGGQVGNVDIAYQWLSLQKEASIKLSPGLDELLLEPEPLAFFLIPSGDVWFDSQKKTVISPGDIYMLDKETWDSASALCAGEQSEILVGSIWKTPSPYTTF